MWQRKMKFYMKMKLGERKVGVHFGRNWNMGWACVTKNRNIVSAL